MNPPLTLDFKVDEIKRHGDLLRIRIIPTSYNYNNNPVSSDINKNICFNYFEKEEDTKYTCDIVGDNNIFEIISSDHYGPEYGIVSDLKKFNSLREKIFSLDYKLDVKYVMRDRYFLITLTYITDSRKAKILKIKEKIKEKNEISNR